jgi:hypothetical protein
MPGGGSPRREDREVSQMTDVTYYVALPFVFSDDRLFSGRALTKQIADDDEACGDTDTYLQWSRPTSAGHCLDQSRAGPNRLFGVLLVRLRITEICQHAVAKIYSTKPAELVITSAHRR